MPGPEPPVVNGLQIDQSLDFQRRFHRVQRVAWHLLALIPVAAVLGLFGDGLLSAVTARGTGVEVAYERFGRRTVDTELEVTFERARSPVTVSIDTRFLNGYSVSEVRPEPERVTARAGRLDYTFAALPGASVSFDLQAQRLGSNRGTVTVSGSPPVHLRQFVYP